MLLSPIIKQSFFKVKIKISNPKLYEFWKQNSKRLQESYPGLQYPYLEESFQLASLSHDEFVDKLHLGIPLEYISKTRHFAGYDFYVDNRVLIPRFETEILYEMGLNYIHQLDKNDIHLAEVGVGSGCLCLSILASSKKSIKLLASDISMDALDVFKINLHTLEDQLEHNFKNHQIQMVEADRLDSPEFKNHKFDLIISNPPYIKRESDEHKVHTNTLKYEPELALFLNDKTYEQWFRELFEQVWVCLSDTGCFMMEGHEDHLQALKTLATSLFEWTKAEVVQDFTHRDRFLVLKK